MTLDAAGIQALQPEGLFSLEDRTVVVTGAAGGIGRWLAAGLGAAGAKVLLTDLDEEGLAEVQGALADAGVEAATLVTDLLGDDAPEQIVAGALERFGGLDVLVNNAGINRRMPILDMDRDSWDLITALNLRVPYFLSRAAAGAMRERGGGAIVNISSLSGLYALEQISVYAPSKAALSNLTRVMALEWAPLGIRVNAIAPGFMDTPLAAPIWEHPDRRRWLLNRVPLKRPGRPDELVAACQLLASAAGSFLTGQTIVVDGGFLAGGRWFTPDE
jgi:NAD(P)-dependent dehydrogenase (short-subunit alcohol dehydrogenase family)